MKKIPTMKTKVLFIFVVLALSIAACSKKKEEAKKTVKREVIKPAVVPKETPPPAPEPEPVVVEKPDNKYFLIKPGGGAQIHVDFVDTFIFETHQKVL